MSAAEYAGVVAGREDAGEARTAPESDSAASASPARRPLAVLLRPLDRLAWLIDGSAPAQAPGAARLRQVVSLLFLAYGIVLAGTAVARGAAPSMGSVVLMMLAVALFLGRGGRFVRDLVPVGLGLLSYGLVSKYAERLDFSVHYKPQIDVDRVIGFGAVPTVWLQHHLYHGRTGPLELFAAAMYLSHFLVPIVLGFALWCTGRARAYAALMFGILTALVLGEMTFVLAPTAPPWLAAEHGFLPPVHHVIRNAFGDLHMSKVAQLDGDPTKYNIVAAVPSLHVGFPVVSLLVSIRYRLPHWVRWLLVLQLLGVTFAIVYAGEHYVVDALAGIVCGVAASWIVANTLTSEKAPSAAQAVTGA